MELVEALSKEEIRNFKLFLNRYKSDKEELPIAKLFDIIRHGVPVDSDIHAEHFPDMKKNAFYRLKNRMNQDIYKSLLALNFDKEEKISILNYLVLASVFRYKNTFDLAFKLLKKAEKKSQQLELDTLTMVIYDEIISLSHEHTTIPLYEYLEKKKTLRDKSRKASELNDLLAEVSWKIKRFDFSSSKDILGTIDNIDLLNLDKANKEHSAAVKLQSQEVIRNILLQNKKFQTIKDYMSRKLSEFQEDGVFTKSNYSEKIRMTVWLINAHLKLREFKEASEVSDSLYIELSSYDKLYHNRYVWTYYQSKFTSDFYLGEIDSCLNWLLKWKEIKSFKEHSYFNLFYYPNLALAYYIKGEIKTAMKSLNHIFQVDIFSDFSAFQKVVFTITDLILYFENGDYDYLSQKIKDVKRKYNHLLKLEEYQRYALFLNILLKMSKRPDWANETKVLNLIDEFQTEHTTVDDNKFETINYNKWLHSKLENSNYYEVILTPA